MASGLAAELVVASVFATVVATGSPTVAHADPNAPQISPLHLQREDAQRLRPQQRAQEREPKHAVVLTTSPDPAATAAEPSYHRGLRRGGLSVLAGAGILAVSSLPFFASDSGEKEDGSSDQDVGTALLVTAAIAGAVGLVLLTASASNGAKSSKSSSGRVQIVPTASASTVGFAITGRL